MDLLYLNCFYKRTDLFQTCSRALTAEALLSIPPSALTTPALSLGHSAHQATAFAISNSTTSNAITTGGGPVIFLEWYPFPLLTTVLDARRINCFRSSTAAWAIVAATRKRGQLFIRIHAWGRRNADANAVRRI